ncbi:PREDICTED: multiple myeloma tumor-associated protein 2 homolog [Ipomoea nil]|uniref:multiple myeloma tumor-associated protein 2 homolog n=1 Tax=Ipomoea nil TaxID=35883 RepID=UPI000901B69A|nr:PREDICTED: multiple myeloma tumor-associated protein 2 homolog [Ipomoea nil]
MYHPTRGGVRGGRDQFAWDDVKVDKHRENYIGHSIKAPVGRWQKGKDLFWYARDKKSQQSDMDAAKEEIQRIKEEEEQAMREALGLAPKRATQSQGNRLDKHEFSELVKRGSTAEDLGAGHAEAARVHGLGFSKVPQPWKESSSLSNLPSSEKMEPSGNTNVQRPEAPTRSEQEGSDNERSQKKRRREEKKHEKYDRREKQEKHDRQEKRHSRDSDERRKHKRDKEKRRHDSD